MRSILDLWRVEITICRCGVQVLAEAGPDGLGITEIAKRIQKQGLRDLRTSRTPEVGPSNSKFKSYLCSHPVKCQKTSPMRLGRSYLTNSIKSGCAGIGGSRPVA